MRSATGSLPVSRGRVQGCHCTSRVSQVGRAGRCVLTGCGIWSLRIRSRRRCCGATRSAGRGCVRDTPFCTLGSPCSSRNATALHCVCTSTLLRRKKWGSKESRDSCTDCPLASVRYCRCVTSTPRRRGRWGCLWASRGASAGAGAGACSVCRSVCVCLNGH